MSRKQKRTLIRILASLALLVTAALLPLEGWPRLAVFLIPYALIGWDVLWEAVSSIFRSNGTFEASNMMLEKGDISQLSRSASRSNWIWSRWTRTRSFS